MHPVCPPAASCDLHGELKEAYGLLAGDERLRLEGSAERLLGVSCSSSEGARPQHSSENSAAALPSAA